MKHIYILLLSLIPLFAFSQSADVKGITIKSSDFGKSGENKLMVSLLLDVESRVNVSSNSMLTITPIIESRDGSEKQSLQSIFLCGRNKEIIIMRDRKIKAEAYKIVRRLNNRQQEISYLVDIPYEKWMNGAAVKLSASTCACTVNKKDYEEKEIAQISIGGNKETIKPIVAFVVPIAEKVKNRNESGRAYLNYHLNSTVLIPTFLENRTELAKINSTINSVKNDPNSKITSIKIEGYASPEGSYANNDRLAKGRAATLKDYVMSFYNFPDNIISVSSKAEDWDGLNAYIMKSKLKDADKARAIMSDKSISNEQRKVSLKALPDFYKDLLDECFPRLRHSDYFINYSVRHFTVDEAKNILKSNPKLLSLNEMYQVAETYKSGSLEFNELFETAVRLFPDDKTANSNAASIAITNGDAAKAEHYMKSSETTSASAINNMGALMILKGENEKANQLFLKAKEMGSSEAAENLKLFSK